MLKQIISLKKIYSGKVRELYDIDNTHMLMLATDRISTFDVILNQLIPNKGTYLTQISLFWFRQLEDIVKSHLTNISVESILHGDELKYATNRSLIVKKLKPLPIEAIVEQELNISGKKAIKRLGIKKFNEANSL